MKLNELDQFGKNKKLENNINKLAEQLYMTIAGELTDLPMPAENLTPVSPQKLESYLKNTNFYTPIKLTIAKQKHKDQKKITLEDIRKFRSTLERSSKKSTILKKSKTSRSSKTIV